MDGGSFVTHFDARVIQRIGPIDADALFHDLRKALSDPDRWHEYIEHVKRLPDGAEAYRFRVAQGVFYAVCRGTYPLTVFTQEQMRGKKYAVKARARHYRKAG